MTNFQTFDPGPKHACATGGTLATTVFDNSVQTDLTKEPDASGASFELTPSSSDYTCVSQSGSSVGQLSWNHTTGVLTVINPDSSQLDEKEPAKRIYHVQVKLTEKAGALAARDEARTVLERVTDSEDRQIVADDIASLPL